MAVIAIEGMKFHARIGYYKAEHLLGNEIEVSVKLAVNYPIEKTQDDLSRTIDYEEVYNLIRETVFVPMHLLETAVQNIITNLSTAYPAVYKMKVRVAKLNPPLQGKVDRVWVEDYWMRSNEK